jgi:tight adherence protein C
MTAQHATFFLCLSGAVAAVGYAICRAAVGDGEAGRLRDRLTGPLVDDVKPRSAARGVVRPVLEKVRDVAAQPFMPDGRERVSSLRQRLAAAGIYDAAAIRYVIAARFLGLFAGLAAGWAAGTAAGVLLLGLSFGGLLGYLAPTFVLKAMVRRNQTALEHGLADAMDLMVVCIEAGLTLDSAMQRVGQELAVSHPAVSREFGIAHMETRVGLSRADSLRNLGARTRSEALQSVAAMLIQAERFGTSTGQALRVEAEALRSRRQIAAEETASKASVKMAFPLVLFMFPATGIVIAGPTIIQLLNSDL